jgi:hypothetical protein
MLAVDIVDIGKSQIMSSYDKWNCERVRSQLKC